MTPRTSFASSAPLLAALAGLSALVLAPLAGTVPLRIRPAQAQSAFQNLQVLPKTISKADLKKVMKAQNKALGVDCSFCHVEPDMAKDIGHKKIARDMMLMTDEINKKYPTAKGQVTCMTCHHGKTEPES